MDIATVALEALSTFGDVAMFAGQHSSSDDKVNIVSVSNKNTKELEYFFNKIQQLEYERFKKEIPNLPKPPPIIIPDPLSKKAYLSEIKKRIYKNRKQILELSILANKPFASKYFPSKYPPGVQKGNKYFLSEKEWNKMKNDINEQTFLKNFLLDMAYLNEALIKELISRAQKNTRRGGRRKTRKRRRKYRRRTRHH
ncbi:hypothetical protein DRO61_10655 [Candidatus Bathyarchaeota archaeon]|nr:MAG: hypothetical protein DRO61_10655 [Candidatus Bathyarchaeota archaeon]